MCGWLYWSLGDHCVLCMLFLPRPLVLLPIAWGRSIYLTVPSKLVSIMLAIAGMVEGCDFCDGAMGAHVTPVVLKSHVGL